MLPLKRIGFSKSKGKGKGKGMGDGPEPVWPIEAGEAHEIKSCDTGTLRYRADTPLNERSGAPMVIAPPSPLSPRRDPVPWDDSIRSGGWSDTDTDWKSTDSDCCLYIEWSRGRGCSDADTEWIWSRGE